MKEFELSFYPIGKKVKSNKPTTILDAVKKLGLDLAGPCGGHGKCGKCVVRISRFPRNIYVPPDPVSKKFLSETDLKKGYRLACTFRVSDDFGIELPSWAYEYDSGIGDAVKLTVLLDGWIHPKLDEEYTIDPIIQLTECRLTKPTLDDNISDLERLIKQLNSQLTENKISYEFKCNSLSNSVLQALSNSLRSNDWQVNVVLANMPNGTELIDILPIYQSDENKSGINSPNYYGIALDIGTSTIVGYLVNLLTGEELGVEAVVNPQIRIGADVITRIRYTTKHKNGDEHLSNILRRSINRVIEELSRKAKIDPLLIYEISVLANTVMLHSFLEIPLAPLGTAPYTPVLTGDSYFSANELNMNINPNGKVYLGPFVSGFLGADAVGAALGANLVPFKDNDLLDGDGNTNLNLILDIGTNGEILLSDGNKILACSTAAGPAFEGNNLRFGLRAVPGAIYDVKIRDEKIFVKTIGNKPAVGITGSGVVDALSEFLVVGAIKRNGNIDPSVEKKWVRYPKNKKVESASVPTMSCDLVLPELLLVPKHRSGLRTSITITQNDIREIQLAKAAIRTGIEVLLDELKISCRDLHQVYLSGAFGNYLNPKNALEIKLLPNLPETKISSIGNSAGSGAKLLLKSRKAKIQARYIADKIEYIDLALHPGFQDLFMKNMEF